MVFQPKNQYVWSGPQRSVSAQEVGEHLEALEEQDGFVTSESFLDSARPLDSPMHKLFEWNNEIAAEKWRKQQSSVIINQLRVVIQSDEDEPRKLVAFVNTKSRNAEKGQFVAISKAKQDKDLMTHILGQARKELQWIKSKYEAYIWFRNMKNAIDQFQKETEEKQ